VDEMTIKPVLKYKRNHGRYFGKVNYESGRLANKILAYFFTGLHKRLKIPLAFFLLNKLKVEEQTKLTLHTMAIVESFG
jgi:hypothetical protein